MQDDQYLIILIDNGFKLITLSTYTIINVANNFKMFGRDNQGLLSSLWWKIDKITLFLIILLIVFGAISLSSASFAAAKRIEVSNSFFIKKQIFYICYSFIVLLLISLFSIEFIKSISLYLYLFFGLIVFSTLFFGVEIKGSTRWISILGFSMQPSEFFKIAITLLNARILSLLKDIDLGRDKIYVYIISFGLCILSMGLLALQPDIGMCCLVFCTWIAQVFVSGIPMFLLMVPVSAFVIFAGFAYILFDHVRYRVDSFIAHLSSSNEIYQIKQSIQTFKNGGLFGVGPWQGKFKFSLPDSHTDFIFSVIAEEFGLLICMILIVIYVFLTIRSIRTVILNHDLFAILVVIGLSTQFIVQVMINIGVNIQLLPAKGMTLPFISYGGSSMIASSILFGIILMINKKKYDANPKIKLMYDS